MRFFNPLREYHDEFWPWASMPPDPMIMFLRTMRDKQDEERRRLWDDQPGGDHRCGTTISHR